MVQLNNIQENLTNKLEACNLTGRVTFDDSALEELKKVSSGDCNLAELYAGTAVLDAIQQQKVTITAEEIQAVNVLEAIQLMAGGKNIWDDVQYIGTQVPTMTPKGAQFKRMLSLRDARENISTMNVIKYDALPPNVLVDQIRYKAHSLIGPQVIIPFKYKPFHSEVEAVAINLANFVSKHVGQPQEVEDLDILLRTNFARPDSLAEFIVQEIKPEKGISRVAKNYRVSRWIGPVNDVAGAQGLVLITKEILCKHDERMLEAYVQSVKPQ
jgi:hypothetical protein